MGGNQDRAAPRGGKGPPHPPKPAPPPQKKAQGSPSRRFQVHPHPIPPIISTMPTTPPSTPTAETAALNTARALILTLQAAEQLDAASAELLNAAEALSRLHRLLTHPPKTCS